MKWRKGKRDMYRRVAYLEQKENRETFVIPAKAGISGQEVSAGLPEVPAFAGMTGSEERAPKLVPGTNL
jgi:hypothetical protein